MTANLYTTNPRPAPLPYASQAGRGEIPAPRPAEPVNPGGPLLREDELCLYVTLGIIVAFVLLMTLVAKTGGL